MVFNSVHFLVFFQIVLIVYWSLRRSTALRIGFLLAASYYFYMSWNVAYASLILGSTLLDFFVARAMHSSANQPRRRLLLLSSLTGNLGVLFVFKYYNFFVTNVANVTGWGGEAGGSGLHALLLPIGISFYTFQTLSYTIDVYRGRLIPERSFLKFALFVSFFPQLVAGPIVRSSHFLPQLEREPRFDDRAAESGLARVLLGLFKKICIADVLGTALVDPVFADPAACSSSILLLSMYGYAFQIYYDFSGYSDIAIGAARMLGFDLPVNFNRPYLATSVGDFWRRWHISLSTWLRDYLYISLGGSRGSAWKTARNLAIVMLLGGLWHGAAWGFVIWGALHGILLGAGRLFKHTTEINPDRPGQAVSSRVARVVVTFHLAAACFVIFRAEDFSTAVAYYTSLLSFGPGTSPVNVSALALASLLLGATLELAPRGLLAMIARAYVSVPSAVQGGIVTGCLLLFAAVGGRNTPFIYFQF